MSGVKRDRREVAEGKDNNIKVTITLPGDGGFRTVSLLELGEDRPTYYDLRRYCIKHHYFNANYYFRVRDEEGKTKYLLEDDEIDSKHNELGLYIPPVTVRVIHQDQGWDEDEDLHTISVPFNCDWEATVDTVLSNWCSKNRRDKESLNNVPFTYHGERIDRTRTLQQILNRHPGQDVPIDLVGKLSVIVEDESCDEKLHHLTVYDNEYISDVMKKYTDLAKRVDRSRKLEGVSGPGATLEDEYRQELDPGSTVFKNEFSKSYIKSGSRKHLHYRAAEFNVVIVDDGDVRTKLTIRDGDTISLVKQRYSQEILQSQGEMSMQIDEDEDMTKKRQKLDILKDNDNLTIVRGGQIQHLEEKNKVYVYKLEPEEVLRVDREDLTQTYTTYMCSDCGKDVRLKSGDAVICRACACRILYKKRTTGVMQYQAR